ncbi:uncharacterized protein LOC143050871 [Mytilus galloprovincialis]|uniref:uncharacterized protein LOC143050869 n=1 Tax=Mytilus galloprovincialis TaxID=29158 RepID=UPI003F7C7F02
MDDWNEKLFWAVKLGKVTHVKNLIAEGASVHYKKSYFNGVSLLRVAKDKAIIEILIEKGINVNSLDVNGSTHLHNAINDGNDELTHVLIKHKANVNAENKASTYLT